MSFSTRSTRHHVPPGQQRVRDIRIDFFRGLAMFFILIAHTHKNPMGVLLPGRFGFSDSTEIFVFCSGMASAIAFGRVFDNQGFIAGLSRIGHRVWQVYWAHICVFLAAVSALVATDALLGTGSTHLDQSGLGAFFAKDVPSHLLALMTLTYLPGLFDILPMYLVILALLPLVMLISTTFGLKAVAAFVLALWAVGTSGVISLPSEPGTSAVWYFNPFTWQLVFFLGFAFMRGWLPQPTYDRRLVIAALAVIIVSIPFAYPPLVENIDILGHANQSLWPLIDKTDFRPVRMLHFLSVGYLAFLAVGPRGERLKGAAVGVISKVGQQALAVFIVGTVVAQLSGVAFEIHGRGPLATVLITMTGAALLVATAYVVAYFKNSPWQAKRHTGSAAAGTAHVVPHTVDERGRAEPMIPVA